MHRLSQRDVLVPSFEYRLHPTSFYFPETADAFADTATSTGATATATASGTPHTVGSWTQVVASTGAEGTLLMVGVISQAGASATDTSTLLDIGIGASSSETPIISGIALGGTLAGNSWQFPVYVPAGSRLSARCQSAVASKQVTVALRLRRIANRIVPSSTVLNFGANTAASQGTLIPVGSANTKGTWTVVGTTSVTLGAVLVSIGHGGDLVMTAGGILVDIGYDAGSGAVTVIEPDIALTATSGEIITYNINPPTTPCNVPAGCRLLARMQSSSTNNGNVDVCIHGIPWRI